MPQKPTDAWTVRPALPVASPRNAVPPNRRATRPWLRLGMLTFVVSLVGSMLWWGWVPPTVTDAHCQWRTNAAWIGVEWTTPPVAPASVAVLAQQLQVQQIRFVFPFITSMKPDGSLGVSSVPSTTFVQQFRRVNSHATIVAWIGLPTPPMDFHDVAARTRVVHTLSTLVRTAAFDGIHIDAEPLPNGDTGYLRFLDELRAALPPSTMISSAGLPWMPPLQAVLTPTNPYRWDTTYYQAIAQRVDQIAVMAYDSHAPHPALYRLWVREQVRGIQHSLAHTGVNLLIGISLARETSASHAPTVENLANGLAGVCAGVVTPQRDAHPLDGVALYALWDATDTDWQTWRHRRYAIQGTE